jgi:hypothetical protein
VPSKKSSPRAHRAKVLGRALVSARTDGNEIMPKFSFLQQPDRPQLINIELGMYQNQKDTI